jgi:hypothetical protein
MDLPPRHRRSFTTSGTMNVSTYEVCRMDSIFFVMDWQDFLSPTRDDAVILLECRGVVLFDCHQDEFEIGQQLEA